MASSHGTPPVFNNKVIAWSFVDYMNPSADVLALSAVEIDLAPIAAGSGITVLWQGKPIFVRHRTPKEIKEAEDVKLSDLIEPQADAERVKPGHADWIVVVGICTHLGCVPLGNQPTDPRGDWGGWFCPCHGSQYDTSGRVRHGPAPAPYGCVPTCRTSNRDRGRTSRRTRPWDRPACCRAARSRDGCRRRS